MNSVRESLRRACAELGWRCAHYAWGCEIEAGRVRMAAEIDSACVLLKYPPGDDPYMTVGIPLCLLSAESLAEAAGRMRRGGEV